MLGHYLIVGEACPPSVHILGADAAEAFFQATMLAARRGDAFLPDLYLSTFKLPAKYCFPVMPDCMTFLAAEYDGPHETETRVLCARLSLGLPTHDESEEHGGGDDGGKRARLDPPVPTKPLPGGAAVSLADMMRRA